jgi:putative ATP-binding cassette transporter
MTPDDETPARPPAGPAKLAAPPAAVAVPAAPAPDGPAVALPPAPPPLAEDEAPPRGGMREVTALLFDLRDSPRRKAVLWLALGVLVVIACNMVAQVRLNAWNGDFFDAIERKDLAGVGRQMLVFLAVIAALLALVVAQTALHELLKVRLRDMLTRRLLDHWLRPARAYRLGITSEAGVNPDRRIEEDVRNLSELSADLGIGLVHHVLLLGSFIGVLWVLSSGIAIPIGGESVVIPGYMVWCALLYAGIGSWLAWRVGRPLVRLNEQRYAREAELRFALVRVSESAESVALYGGERDERRLIDRTLENVLVAMRRVVFAVARLTWITSGYGWIAIVVPTLVALPGYFYGGLTLGGLMMVVGAFNQVQQALRWFVDNYARIAQWRAVLHRVTFLHAALRALEEPDEDEPRIALAHHPEGKLAFRDVSVLLADGGVIIKEANCEFGPGERVLIIGESGSGKSTLFRAIAGLWPWGTGTILLPPREGMMFMPQRPYLPLGTLRAAVAYPAAPEDFGTEAVAAALERVGLPEFVPLLDREDRWDRLMSIGQQQRLAFARLLLHKPAWVFLDEATAALDQDNQARVMSLFERELAGVTLVTIGHRPDLAPFHTRTLELVATTTGAKLRRKRPPVPEHANLFRVLLAFLSGRSRPPAR